MQINSTIKSQEDFLSILRTSVTDSEFLNMPTIGFKAETEQSTLNKGGKANRMLTEHNIDINNIVKHSSGTALCPLGEKGYKEFVINAFLKQYKDTSELPKSMTNEKVKEIIGENTVSDYQPKARKWGEHLEGDLHNTIIKHNGNHYMVLYFVHGTVNKLKVTHSLNGKTFDPKDEKYSEFLKKKSPDNKVATEILGIPFKFSYRTYKLCNLTYFSCRGNKYNVDIPKW